MISEPWEVCKDLGVALLPESVARAQATSGGLVLVPVSDPPLRCQVKLVAPQDPPVSAAGQAFIRSVREFMDAAAGEAGPAAPQTGRKESP
jgi:DNA-binding transcriptional LysR family regulator